MDTQHLASYLRQTRRPAHLGFSLKKAAQAAGTAALDSAQDAAGDYIEEKVTEATGSESFGKATRSGFNAGVDEAQGQTQDQTQNSQIDLNLLRSVAPLITQRRFAPTTIDYGKIAALRLPSRLVDLPTSTANQNLITDGSGYVESPEPTTESAEGDGKKKALIIGGVIFALAAIGGGVYFATRKK